MPWSRLLEAQSAAMAKGATFAMGPAPDGVAIPRHPFDPDAPVESADVPMIISTTLDDAGTRYTNFDLDEAGLQVELAKLAPERSEEITALYSAKNGNGSPYRRQVQAVTDATFRKRAIAQAERRTELSQARTWMYLWRWPTPASGGKFGAVHGQDVDAAFYNRRAPMCGSGNEPGSSLTHRFASTLIAFAKTGDPNNPEIPAWPTYDVQTRQTMIFDADDRVQSDPRSDFRQFWS
jgi:para-nitrobenzyl esterase